MKPAGAGSLQLAERKARRVTASLSAALKAPPHPTGTSPATAVTSAASQSAYMVRLLQQIELAVLNRAHEGAPFARGEEEDRTRLVLAVPDGRASARQWRGLHAVAVTVAVSTLSPECAGKIVAIRFDPFATPLTRIVVRPVSPSRHTSVHSNDPYLMRVAKSSLTLTISNKPQVQASHLSSESSWSGGQRWLLSCTCRHMRQPSPRNPQMALFPDKRWYVRSGNGERKPRQSVTPDHGGRRGARRGAHPQRGTHVFRPTTRVAPAVTRDHRSDSPASSAHVCRTLSFRRTTGPEVGSISSYAATPPEAASRIVSKLAANRKRPAAIGAIAARCQAIPGG